MFQQYFAGGSLLDLPIFAMAIFIATFLIVLIKVWRQNPADPALIELSRLPLDDDRAAQLGEE